MKVAIVGYGRMGRAIYSILLGSNEEVVSIIDPLSNAKEVTSSVLDAASLGDAEVVIDFSSPSSAVDNIIMYSKLGIPAVIGTTGWYSEIDKLKSIIEGDEAKILYSGNYSMGVAIFLRLVNRAGLLINKCKGYDVSIREVHHTGKADSPSGTALMIADELLSTVDKKKELLIGNSNGKIRQEQLQITSERVGKVPGIHEVTLDSDFDTITLTHSARSREGFASGAVEAARWILATDKKGLLTMDDFLDEFLGEL